MNQSSGFDDFYSDFSLLFIVHWILPSSENIYQLSNALRWAHVTHSAVCWKTWYWDALEKYFVKSIFCKILSKPFSQKFREIKLLPAAVWKSTVKQDYGKKSWNQLISNFFSKQIGLTEKMFPKNGDHVL